MPTTECIDNAPVDQIIEPSHREESVSISGLRVLIVDDQVHNRNIMGERIRVLGCVPLLAENGYQGLDIVRSEKPDLILLDIMMQDMNGTEVLKHLKTQNDLASIPVLMITAVDDDKTLTRCFELGADDYIIKPFRSRDFDARVQACLRRKKLQDEREWLLADLRRSYENLRQAEQARDTLSHMVVHDLNDPLMGISGRIELLLQRLAKPLVDKDLLKSDLAEMQVSAEHMKMLVQGILDAAKLEDGTMTVKLETIDCSHLVQVTCEAAQPLAHFSHVNLTYELHENPLTVESDPTLLSRILHNLVGNAIKHSPAKGTVTCRSLNRNGECVISIDDEGPGIPPHLREKVFEKFYQIERETPGERSGVGLGLAFCKMATDRLGGRIWVENGPEGKGTSFKVAIRLIARPEL
ncbi:MAG: hybrid sensor histidine kinase/response regulator [candidate division Zixibacteria bacterium]|nr:hybrid sensor histidine kinase/response regulator [candidate division Zixibacteria bacterium]